GHYAREESARLGAEGEVRGRDREDDRLLQRLFGKGRAGRPHQMMRTARLTLSIAVLDLAFCSLFSPDADSADLSAIKAKLAPELASFKAANAQYQKSRWAQTPKASVYQPAGITREDLHECNVALQAVLTEIDRILWAFD